MADLVGRHATARLSELLASFRIVVLGGARQTGKTTLVSKLINLPPGSRFSLDDEDALRAATEDPRGFIDALPTPAAIDEFQRAGRGLLLAAKRRADHDSSRGQLLLTGSANYLADRSISETLAGRAGRLVLSPLSAGERRGIRETFVDRLFEPKSWPGSRSPSPNRPDLIDWLLEGGYPEVVTESLRGRRRRDWFEAYVGDVVSREALRPMADVRMESELRRLLRLLAARTGQELVISDIASDAELSRQTAANYLSLLEALYLVVLIPAWSSSATTRAKRRPKVVLIDTGLAADLCGVGEAAFAPTAGGSIAGPLFETLVVTEVHKQSSWSERAVDLMHFRDRRGAEVDLIVLDRRTGRLAGIEAKLTATPTQRDARHLAMLRDRLGEQFSVGLVVHAGENTLPLGEQIWAVPVSALWRSD